jgi:hypothetical protein
MIVQGFVWQREGFQWGQSTTSITKMTFKEKLL